MRESNIERRTFNIEYGIPASRDEQNDVRHRRVISILSSVVLV